MKKWYRRREGEKKKPEKRKEGGRVRKEKGERNRKKEKKGTVVQRKRSLKKVPPSPIYTLHFCDVPGGVDELVVSMFSCFLFIYRYIV